MRRNRNDKYKRKKISLELGVRVLISALVLSGISALYVYSWVLIY